MSCRKLYSLLVLTSLFVFPAFAQAKTVRMHLINPNTYLDEHYFAQINVPSSWKVGSMKLIQPYDTYFVATSKVSDDCRAAYRVASNELGVSPINPSHIQGSIKQKINPIGGTATNPVGSWDWEVDFKPNGKPTGLYLSAAAYSTTGINPLYPSVSIIMTSSCYENPKTDRESKQENKEFQMLRSQAYSVLRSFQLVS